MDSDERIPDLNYKSDQIALQDWTRAFVSPQAPLTWGQHGRSDLAYALLPMCWVMGVSRSGISFSVARRSA